MALVCCYTVQYHSAAEAEGSSQKVHELCFVFGMISLLSHTIRTTINCEFDAVKQHLIAYPGHGKLLGYAVLICRQRRE